MQKYEIEVAGRTLSIETGQLAQQANGSVLMRYGDTVVLVTAVAGGAREGTDFMPLTVDFEAAYPVRSSAARAVPPRRPFWPRA